MSSPSIAPELIRTLPDVLTIGHGIGFGPAHIVVERFDHKTKTVRFAIRAPTLLSITCGSHGVRSGPISFQAMRTMKAEQRESLDCHFGDRIRVNDLFVLVVDDILEAGVRLFTANPRDWPAHHVKS